LPSDYLPLLIFLFACSFITTVSLWLPHYLGPRLPNKAKSEVVESGKINYGDARRRVPIQYYMIAMLFILFDIEVLFFYPWAVLFWDLKWYGLLQIGIFALLLVESFIYVWKKGALEWD
jgi:NADH-quinone oxidoreductase subunit A